MSTATLRTKAAILCFAATWGIAPPSLSAQAGRPSKAGPSGPPSSKYPPNLSLIQDGRCDGGSFWAVKNSDQNRAYSVTVRVYSSRQYPSYPQDEVKTAAAGATLSSVATMGVGGGGAPPQHFRFEIRGGSPI